MKIGNHFDFGKASQIINVKLHQVATLPTVWAGGLVYLTTDNKVYYGNGTSWVPINDIAGLITGVTNGAGITVTTDGAGVATVTLVTDDTTLEKVSAAAGAAARIKDLGVSTAKIANLGVTTAKIADANVTTAKILDANVTTAKILDANVTEAKLATNSVTTIKVADKNITFAKINDIPTMTVIGKLTAATGTSYAVNVLTDLDVVIGNHDSLASAKAAKDYVDKVVGGLGNLEGGFSAVGTTFPVGSGGTKKGDYWYVTVAGTVQGVVFNIGDVLIANKDAASTTLIADWIFLEVNRDQATTSTLGIIMLATQAEARAMSSTTKALTPSNLGDVKASDAETQTGTATDRFITPANLSARTALESRTGVVAFASNAEALAMSSQTKALYPNHLLQVAATGAEVITGTEAKKWISPLALVSRVASETATGLIEIANQTEVNTGTDDTRAVTPLKLKVYVDSVLGAYGKYVGNIGNGSATSIAVTHGLNTRDLTVEVWDNASFETVLADVIRTSLSQVTISFASAPTTDQYRVFIRK